MAKEVLAEKVVQQAETYAGLRRQRWRRRLRQAGFGLVCGGGGAALLWLTQTLLG